MLPRQFVVFVIEYGKCFLLVALGVVFQACEAVFVERSLVQKCMGVGVGVVAQGR